MKRLERGIVMERTLKLVGRISNEIFMLRYPRSILAFCDYDMAYFAENAVNLCNEALKSGELDFDRATDLRNSLKDAHVYVEHNIRTIYDKIVIDCWIDFVCRRDGVGTGGLWNRFVDCKTPFEKIVFMRLCDYRYNRAINEWLNLVRIQDYAKSKISFLFSKSLGSAQEAAARRNYFDLMFSVTARELGCSAEELGATKVFSVGRLPSAPFMFPNISKDIVKNVLADFDYSEDYSDSVCVGENSDQTAMDVFSHMKAGLAGEFDSYNISRSQMENSPSKVYMPCGLKAAVDLEIDAIIESGGWLSRCRRCGRYFLRDKDNNAEYCSLFNPVGKTCLEIYEEEHPKSLVTPEMEQSCRKITDEMYSRVGSGMSLVEYEGWKTYLDALVQKVRNGEISPTELSEFIEYSKTMDLSRSNPVVEVPHKEQEHPHERIIKPFVPERIQRSEISPPTPEPQEETEEQRRVRREGFFTSPTVQRQKSERPAVSHIIRAGEQLPENPRSAERVEGFTPFAADNSRRQNGTFDAYSPPQPNEKQSAYNQSREENPPADTPHSYEAPAAEQPVFTVFAQPDFGSFGQPPQQNIEQPFKAQKPPVQERERLNAEPDTMPKDFVAFTEDFARETAAHETAFHETVVNEEAVHEADAKASAEAAPIPRPKVVRKNAAAISAYGKIAGTPLVSPAPELDQVLPPTPQEQTEPVADTDPFRDIGSIFDVLEQSENDMSGAGTTAAFGELADARRSDMNANSRRDEGSSLLSDVISAHKGESISGEPSQDAAAAASDSQEKLPERVTASNAPSGIWTEERGLFPDSGGHEEELAARKEKKRSRSSKTQRLFDVIMREPDDNPNFRRK